MTSQFQCPACGQTLTVKSETPTIAGWMTTPMRTMNFTTTGPGQPPPLAAGMSYRREEPARAPTPEDVWVPLAWACFTGIACSCGGAALCLLWPKMFPLWTPLVVFFIATCVTWLLLLFDWRGLLRRVEEITQADLDGDGEVGEPSVTRVDITDHKAWYRVDLPVPPAIAKQVATAHLKMGCKFSRRDLRERTDISDDGVEKLQRMFIERGWGSYVDGKPNHPDGLIPNPIGRRILDSFLGGGA